MGQFYQITIYFKKEGKKIHKVTFIDSLKIIPFSVSEIAKSFNLPISKLSLDYDKPREKGYILNEEERKYITNDVLIVAKALKTLFDEDLTKMTQGSNALSDFKKMIEKSKFSRLFPELDYDLDKLLRHSYRGGFTYLNPIYKNKKVKNIINLDVNSLYPSVLYDKPMPIGEPIYFEGEYKEDKIYPLYIQQLECTFEIKENHIPTIQLKNKFGFRPNEYVLSSKAKDENGNIINLPITLTLTSVDLNLFFKHYKVSNLKFIWGWKFKSMNNIFTDYIDKWVSRKNKATIEKNKGQRTLSKLMLNALYGKFATSLDVKSKLPYLSEEGIVKYNFSEKDVKKGLYIPIGAFTTAYAREITISTSQIIKEYSINKYNEDKYIYSDTDSIKTTLSIEELEKIVNIDEIKLGFWKNEGLARRGKFVRQKTYVEEFYKKCVLRGKKITKTTKYVKTNKKIRGFNHFSELHITCAGLPKNCYDKVTFNNFKEGFTCSGKLTFSHVRGGVKLIDTEFTIKEDKIL